MYTNPKTAHQYRAELTALFAYVGVSHPRALTDAAVNHWVAQARANNTRRSRLARICTFLGWCARQGHADPALVEELQSRDNPLRATPPLYGKLQGKYPARWLTYEEAYESLLGVCDDSDVGRRDELVLRSGRDLRRGLHHLSAGTKVWLLPAQWGDGWESALVVGRHIGSKRLVQMVVPLRHLENFRVQAVYSPAVLREMTKPCDAEQGEPRQWASEEEATSIIARHPFTCGRLG